MSNPQNERNMGIINEFRANAGKVGGHFEGRSLLLLHTIGAKSGEERINPVACVRDGDCLVIIASKGGAPPTRIGIITCWLIRWSRWKPVPKLFGPSNRCDRTGTEPFVQPDGRYDARLCRVPTKDHTRHSGDRADTREINERVRILGV